MLLALFGLSATSWLAIIVLIIVMFLLFGKFAP